MEKRRCRYCGKPLPPGSLATRLYCSDRCRWDYINRRRREAREERRLVSAPDRKPYDPWAKNDLDTLTIEKLLALSAIDPMPADFPS